MAYIGQDTKKQLAPAIKAVLKKFGVKGTIGINNHSSLVVNLKEGVIDFGEVYHQVNTYHIEKFYGTGIAGQFLNELVTAMKGTKWYNNTDAQIDYFDIAYYVYINIGQWDKEYKVVEAA
jgi:hypothetical protein